jgi:hypothetical protein
VSGHLEEADGLRLAFQKLGDQASLEDVDVDRLWRAVTSEASPEERREVVDRVARDPSWGLAWRLAHELWTASREKTTPRRFARAWSSGLGLSALAAALLATLGVGLWIAQGPTPATHREPTALGVESLVPPDTPLPRRDPVLRWTGPPGATYVVRITSEDLLRVHATPDLTATEYSLPVEFTSGLPAGARVVWQVEARLPGGGTVRSDTFVSTLE